MQRLKGDKSDLLNAVRQIRMVVFDFDGVFTDNSVIVSQDGTESVICNRSDGLGLTALKESGIILLVISKEVNPVVSARCRKLALPCIQGCDDKITALKQECNKIGIPLKQIAFMGNDINDIECLKEAGIAVCVADSHSAVLPYAHFITKLPGGKGAVREFCDLVIGVKNGKLSTEAI